MGRPTKYKESDFWSLVKIAGVDDCWPFTGMLDNDGYGKIRIAPEYLAHRIAYRFKVAAIPNGGHILHTCDYPACCNPKHLFLGNHSINMQDMWDKGRHVRPSGERNNHAKLTVEDVKEIRRRYANGDTQVVIAKKWNVSQTNVSMIVRGETWV